MAQPPFPILDPGLGILRRAQGKLTSPQAGEMTAMLFLFFPSPGGEAMH